MSHLANLLHASITPREPIIHDAGRFVGRTLSWLRWAIIGAMWGITVLWPFQGRFDHAIWMLIAAFAGYNLIIDLLRYRVPRLWSFAWVPVLDLLVVALLYFLDFDPGGPSFIFFYLALLTAATTVPLIPTILYTMAVIAVVALIAPTLPGWQPTPENLRELSARLVLMVLVGIGTSILTRRLVLEYEHAHSMRDEAERLEALDRLRNDFVSTVSHDLRTPLTAIQATLGLLEEAVRERLRADEQRMWSNARRNVERLGLLIDDLLTLNQIQAGVLHLDREPLDLRTIVTDMLSSVFPLLRMKGQVLDVDLPEPLLVTADARRMEQVIVNLLANANLHTPPGTNIAIAACVHEHAIQLSVSDTGPGIPAAELDAIFERFHRLPSGDKGSGLGLAIAKAIIELHGGRIWAESEPGHGTSFHITLPRTAGDAVGLPRVDDVRPDHS